jgi:hypothetical protein
VNPCICEPSNSGGTCGVKLLSRMPTTEGSSVTGLRSRAEIALVSSSSTDCLVTGWSRSVDGCVNSAASSGNDPSDERSGEVANLGAMEPLGSLSSLALPGCSTAAFFVISEALRELTRDRTGGFLLSSIWNFCTLSARSAYCSSNAVAIREPGFSRTN